MDEIWALVISNRRTLFEDTSVELYKTPAQAVEKICALSKELEDELNEEYVTQQCLDEELTLEHHGFHYTITLTRFHSK